MIFGFWRRRRERRDDEVLADYVDRGPGGRGDAVVSERLRARGDALAETAALLRAVERVNVPRSFILTSVPDARPAARDLSVRPGWPRALYRAPAIAAAAAAFVLGLLVVGNLAGVLDQGGGGGSSGESADATALTTASAPAFAAPGGAPEFPESQASATAAPAPTAAPAFALTAPAAGDAGLAPSPMSPEESAAGGEPEPGVPLDGGAAGLAGIAGPAGAFGAPGVPGEPGAVDETTPDAPARAGRVPEPDGAEAGAGDLGGERGAAPGAASAELFEAVAGTGDDDEIGLPLWQLELAFGLLALSLGGVALALGRRH